MNDEQLDQARMRDIIRFQMAYSRQKVISTWVLSALIVAIYLLEEYWGGSQNIAILTRMGANVKARVLSGEYFRLCSAVFLHAGFLHVFFNTYVLVVLGGFFNRILGESRFLTIFFVSGIAGSITSILLGKAEVSVGASGALWGLFGASLGLTVFKNSLLPDLIRLRLRRITLINLVINLGISFLPMIDMWAHLGGGVSGFLISLVIIYFSRTKELYRLSTAMFSITAFMLSLIYLLAIGYDLYKYKPWIDALREPLKPIELKTVPFTMDIPKGLVAKPGPKNSRAHSYFLFGDPQVDQMVMEVQFIEEKSLGHAAGNPWLRTQRQKLLTDPSVPAEVKKTVYLRDDLEGGVLYFEQVNKEAQMIAHNYLITRNGYAIKVGLLVPSRIKREQMDEMAQKILDSIHRNTK